MAAHGDEALGPLNLTLLSQEGGLVASLTDLRLTARLARSELPDAQRDELQHGARSLAACCAAARTPAANRDAAQRVCEYGGRLFEALLPAPIRTFLLESPARAVSLQIDPKLAWVPWELVFDGESFFGEKFCLTRQVLCDEAPGGPRRADPPRGAFKVFVLTGRAAHETGESSTQDLVTGLRIMEGVAVSSASVVDVAPDDLLDLIGACDVVHCLGELEGRIAPSGAAARRTAGAAPLTLEAIGRLPSPPQLLVLQNTASPGDGPVDAGVDLALATDACRLGLNLLACEAADRHAGVEFVLALYRQLLAGLPLGGAVRGARVELHRRFGIARLAELQPRLYGDAAAVPFAKERHTRGEDNLRQVTIMSFDLVESTRLLSALGAERYSEVLAEYHRRCTHILEACGGAPDDPQGDDGLMCYFGFPVAREDAAVQALRAGLEMIDAVHALGLAVRIGVCTGEVVVRDGQPVGPAIHLAARLQAIGAPGALTVGESTRRIVKERYRFLPLEPVAVLKGFDKPEPIYRVLGPAQEAGAGGPDPGALAGPSMTPFVGRQRELKALEEHWAAVRGGALRLVRLVGDAGIGKSRLVREFKRSLTAQGSQVYECRCAPDHANSAFHPLIAALRNEVHLRGGESVDVVLDRLRRLVARAGSSGDTAIALLADLLSIPLPEPLDAAAIQSPDRRRQLTLELLVALARQRVLGTAACLIVEDVHWVDPSTAEFLNRLAIAAKDEPLLILVTERSDGEARWHPRLAVHEAELRGLSPELARSLVLGTCGDARLPTDLVHLIAARADGVPLFIEESTRMALELQAGQAGAAAKETSPPVPTTIVDLLTARLDRLGSAKQIAQVGGTIGREFPLALLEAVLAHPGSPFAAESLPEQLAALMRSGLLVARADVDGARYAFKHALVRDAAYRSLLERERARLHHVIAQVIGEQFRELAERQPELLAVHYTEAGLHAEALRAWESAARQAASRSAHAEAIGHLRSALMVLMRMPQDVQRDRLELRLQLLLAARLIATDGYGAQRVERVYARAMELASALGDEAALMKILLGLEGYHFMRADFSQAMAHATDAAARAQRDAGGIQALQANWAIANIVMHQGEMEAAVRQMDDCRAACDRLEHRPEAVQDPGVMCLCYSAWSMWQLGFPDQALQRALAVVARAEQIRHKFSLGEAYGFRAAVQHFRGENAAALESAERAIEICEEGGFAVWLAHARIMRGRIVAELGNCAAGIEEMRQAYELWAATGAVVTTPFYLAMRAEGLALGGRPDEGLVLLEQALGIVERTGERYYEPEIRRLLGQLVLQSAAVAGADRRAEAELRLRQAHDCAGTLRMKSLTLRCAISLFDLWVAQGRRELAADVLRPAYRAIDEGANTRDLMSARQRLAGVDGG